MIKHLKHREINRDKWDAAIQQSYLPLVYALSWYLDRVCPDWEALVEGDYKAVFPLTGKRKFGIHYLYQPYFTQQLGSFSKKKDEGLKDFLDALPEKYKYIQITLNEKNSLPQGDWEVVTNQTYHLNLNEKIEVIQKSYSENAKRNLKKAVRNKLQIVKDDRFGELIQLFRENRGSKLKSLINSHFSMLLDVMKESKHREKACAYSVYNENGNYCAGAFFLKSFRRYIFLFSATNEEGRQTGAMTALIDKFIGGHCETKMLLDFEGSNMENLVRFYGGFGSKPVIYNGLVINKLPGIIRWMK